MPFRTIQDVISFTQKNLNKNSFFRPLKTNYDTVDCLLYLSKNLYSFDFDKSIITLDPHIDVNFDTFICFQVKKDWDVTFKYYDEILDKWEKKKKTIKNLLKEQVNIILIVINESICRETSKERTEFEKPEVKDLFFLFTNRINNAYFQF